MTFLATDARDGDSESVLSASVDRVAIGEIPSPPLSPQHSNGS